MARKCLPLIFAFWLIAGVRASASDFSQAQASASPQAVKQVTTEIPYRDGMFVLVSDFQETIGKTRYRATGHVVITYKDMRITCDEAEYDEVTQEGTTKGTTQFTQNQQWLKCSRAEFNLRNQTAKFYDAEGYTDQQFLIQGKIMRKTGRDTYVLEQGSLTSCLERNPKWGFGVGGGTVHVDRTARLRRVVFKLKGVPVLYIPYIIVPMQNKVRSSGFLPFHMGSSNSKGRQFSLGYFQTLGSSADITLYGDYFSLRGLGYGGFFRARPNAQTDLKIQAYGVRDKLNQGGAHLVVDGVSQFNSEFRAVASVNVTSNFRFRQAFSEGFRSATIPEEQSILFATRSHDSFSANFAYQRDEVLFPTRSLVVQKSPAIEFVSLGKSLGKLPLILYLRAGAEGLSRIDSNIETPGIIGRLDFHPRLALRLPTLAGFSLMPSFGIRETYYSARLSQDAQPLALSTPLRRQYTDLEIDLRTPQLERTFHSQRSGEFKHLIEPQIIYRRINGISDLRETIRFDEEDAIADTNELEYGLVNRIVRSRETNSGTRESFEFLSLRIVQKYYFDPSFGGAFIPGDPNQFYPLNTLTGFSATGIESTRSPTSVILRVTPKPGISYDARADYDTKLHRLRDSSVSAYWQQNRLFVAGTYFKTNAVEPSLFQSHHLQGQLEYGDRTRGFSASVSLSYNLQTHALLNSNSRLNYVWNCCGVSLEYQQFDLGLRTESRITFSFSLKGIGNFGTIKRPESLFGF